MIRLKGMIDRVPRTAFYVAAALVQIVLIAIMVIDRVRVLRTGVEVKLHTHAVDPRDFLRGDYVTLGYDMSTLPAGDLKETPFRSATIFVKLAPDEEGFYKPISVHSQPVAVDGKELLMRGRVRSPCGQVYCDTLWLSYGIERYFVPEGEGRAIELSRNAGKVAVVAAVTSSGRAAIKRLLIDGKPIYDEPLF